MKAVARSADDTRLDIRIALPRGAEYRARADDEDFSVLAEFPELRSVALSSLKVASVDLRGLKRLEQLGAPATKPVGLALEQADLPALDHLLLEDPTNDFMQYEVKARPTVLELFEARKLTGVPPMPWLSKTKFLLVHGARDFDCTGLSALPSLRYVQFSGITRLGHLEKIADSKVLDLIEFEDCGSAPGTDMRDVLAKRLLLVGDRLPFSRVDVASLPEERRALWTVPPVLDDGRENNNRLPYDYSDAFRRRSRPK